jgi:hypothetical protein
MTWFAAAVLLRTPSEGVDEFNVSVFPFRASRLEEANERAKEWGARIAASYSAPDDGGRWVFERVLVVDEMIEDELREGVEVLSFFTNQKGVAEIDSAIADSYTPRERVTRSVHPRPNR